ncbi:MAG: response regulator [Candidatus Thermoplasmatota archaeon]|nr:response regulator [Candidatus Thermoplasmatota archaeon]
MTKRIMFVDDEEDTVFSVKVLLENAEEKYEFIGVNSGEKCLELLETGIQPDLILLDIMMPDLSGWEVYDKLRGNPNWTNIPIVFLTARTDKVAKESGIFLADGYVEKPIDANVLLPVINKILHKGKSL